MYCVSVLIVDKGIKSYGVLANAAFVLGLTAGRGFPDDKFGPDVVDGDGSIHKYLTTMSHYVRRAGQSKLRALRREFVKDPKVLVIDYTEDAATTDYHEYTRNLGNHSGDEIQYRAVYIYGPEEIIVPRTKNLSRLP